jgi:C-terminal processing protease CtpA/Prc
LGFGPIEPFQTSANQAMAAVARTKALIIDMRDNGGGSPETVDYLVSFFFDPKTPVHINDLIYRNPGTDSYKREEYRTKPTPSYYKKPVYLLTAARTFSGGEEFVYDLQTQKRARVIGETSGGGANPGGAPQINAHFRIFIPAGRAENPITKTNWEGTGVVPDVAVARDQALRVAMLEITHDKALKTEKAMDTDAFAPKHLLKFRDAPQPGGKAALHRQMDQLARGEPDYAKLTDNMAKWTREELPRLKNILTTVGQVKSVTFKNVDDAGADVYEVACANGKLRSGIYLSPDGKVAVNWFQTLAGAN